MATRDAKADKRKRYEPSDRLQDREQAAKLLCTDAGGRCRSLLAPALKCAHASQIGLREMRSQTYELFRGSARRSRERVPATAAAG